MGLLDSNPGEVASIFASAISDLEDVTVIDWVHKRIHDGYHFVNSYSKNLSAGSSLDVTITAPASAVGFIHYSGQIESNLSGTWTFSISPEVSGGSTLTSYNSKRNSTTTSGAVIKGTQTVTSAGTVVETHIMGSNSNPSKVGGSAEIRNEVILNPSTTYLIQFIADATSTKTCINSSFYLET